MIAKSITLMIYDLNGACLAMSSSEQMAGLFTTTDPGWDKVRWGQEY
jgi:hypothetical protein